MKDEGQDTFKTTLWRYTSSRVSDETTKKHLRFIFDLFKKQTRGWKITRSRSVEPTLREYPNRQWQYRFDITLRRESSDASALLEVRVVLDQLLRHSQKFKEHPFQWQAAPTAAEIESVNKDRAQRWKENPSAFPECASEDEAAGINISHIEDMDVSSIIPAHAIRIPQELLDGTDNSKISKHEAFRGIYGREPHIRRALRSIDAFQRSASHRHNEKTDIDMSRNHVLYWGPPAAAKSRIVRGLRRLLPKGSYFTLDATSATKAGIVKLFRDTFRSACPPVIFVEEIEKCQDLTAWLSMLDDRGEISKFTHFKQDKFSVNFLCIATCNDIHLLNTVLKGAVGSRFGHQIYVPRPNAAEMELVLHDRVKELKGDPKWVDICLSFMKEFDTDDPREIKSWLDYGSALLDFSAYNDLKAMYHRHQYDQGIRHNEPDDADTVSFNNRSNGSSHSEYERSMAAFRNGQFDQQSRRK